jgi:hypothetical protein
MRRLIVAALAAAIVVSAASVAWALSNPTLTHTNLTTTSVRLTWTDAGNEDTYDVREVLTSGFVVLATLPKNTLAYNVTGVTPGTTHTYRIVARKGGSTALSNPDTITFPSANTAPTAVPKSATVAEASSVVVTLEATDVQQCELAFAIATQPAHGTLSSITARPCVAGSPNRDTADVTYTANAEYQGTDSFTYTASDGTLTSAAVTVSIGNTPYRAFTAGSYWNRPLPSDAPIATNSQAIIDEIKTYANGGYPRVTADGEAFAEPFYWSDASDPTYTVIPSGGGPDLFGVHIPAEARPAASSDAQFSLFDMAKGVSVKLFNATYDSATDTWSATGTAEYDLLSNGLECTLPESDRVCPMNKGHRGFPPAIHGVRFEEVAAGLIAHTVKVGLDKTAECHVYPATGNEFGKGGNLTCEGLVLRIRPDIDLAARGLTGGPLVIAKMMQDYGVVIGETGGVALNVKLENLDIEGRSENWTDLGVTSNQVFNGYLTLDDFVVIEPGYHRP